ncbi:MAG: hypothetical protein IPM57_07375 [Oligoflexia bacterium]|nr:hypothetical protein [Oligoflexia bacterium]
MKFILMFLLLASYSANASDSLRVEVFKNACEKNYCRLISAINKSLCTSARIDLEKGEKIPKIKNNTYLQKAIIENENKAVCNQAVNAYVKESAEYLVQAFKNEQAKNPRFNSVSDIPRCEKLTSQSIYSNCADYEADVTAGNRLLNPNESKVHVAANYPQADKKNKKEQAPTYINTKGQMNKKGSRAQ